MLSVPLKMGGPKQNHICIAAGKKQYKKCALPAKFQRKSPNQTAKSAGCCSDIICALEVQT
tara:strand:+ start:779 stop:961 length:183 start_codon:yes stop_codon:yes gene_type:complete